jgi:hypothetical protein
MKVIFIFNRFRSQKGEDTIVPFLQIIIRPTDQRIFGQHENINCGGQ